MRPEARSRRVFAITQSKAKMYEYGVPPADHIKIEVDPATLLTLTIGILGDVAAQVNTGSASPAQIATHRESLRFSARYFDAIRRSRLLQQVERDLLLVGAAAYYLCDLPGSAKVLAKELPVDGLILGARGLESLVTWLLKDEFQQPLRAARGVYSPLIEAISWTLARYRRDGSVDADLLDRTAQLRKLAYEIGTPKELLLADVASAIARRRRDNSTWYCLPRFSELSVEVWRPVLQMPHFMSELWPAQRLLGEKGVFAGKSAVVQMPTSAGKTRATEIIIRSAFLSGRASLAVVVAPFRALCHEIRESLANAFVGEGIDIDELSDVLQADYDTGELIAQRGVVIVTPEKLLYVLRHAPELADHVGLLIYDEGHQFDTGTRGVTYELLLTSLKRLLPSDVQTILISAVMPNAEAIGKWLIGEEPNLVAGTGLLPTDRTVAFASWVETLGQLKFVEQDRPDDDLFYVPRVLQQYPLQLRGKERKPRFFPDRGDAHEVALCLGLKLANEGGVALFCGRKSTAAGICDSIVEAYGRQLVLRPPIEFSERSEVIRVAKLYEENLGTSASATQCAALGIFTHHGNTPHGIRLAVEYAMKENLARFVVCTSTLAQGVNLPIRYLIIGSVNQGTGPIKVRDFHNLIGRAGRAGMYTEGSILFADHSWYDAERGQRSSRWREISSLLRPDMSEPCGSSLLSVMQPLYSDAGQELPHVDPMDVVREYVMHSGDKSDWSHALAQRWRHPRFPTGRLEGQIDERAEILAAIESYLLANWDVLGTDSVDAINALVHETLAFALGDATEKQALLEIFAALADNVRRRISDSSQRALYGRTLYGAGEAAALGQWVVDNFEALVATDTDEALFLAIWPALISRLSKAKLSKCRPEDQVPKLASGWLSGRSFGDLLGDLLVAGAWMQAGTQMRQLKVEQVIEMTEGELAFDGALTIGAIAEIVGELFAESLEADDLKERLEGLQKRLKYGLPTGAAVAVYEAGFADRVIAQALTPLVGNASSRNDVTRSLKAQRDAAAAVVAAYPRHFQEVLKRVLG